MTIALMPEARYVMRVKRIQTTPFIRFVMSLKGSFCDGVVQCEVSPRGCGEQDAGRDKRQGEALFFHCLRIGTRLYIFLLVASKGFQEDCFLLQGFKGLLYSWFFERAFEVYEE